MDQVHMGRCLCGHISFTAKGPPNNVTNCHCRTCQKASGAAYVTWAEFPAAHVTWTGAEPTWRASSDRAERGFCPQCGTPVVFRYTEGDAIDLPSVLFDNPDTFAPQYDIWTDDHRSWVVLDEHLARFFKERDAKPGT